VLFALDVCLCLEAIYLMAAAENIQPATGWLALAVAAGIDAMLRIPTRPMTDEERDEWING